jgi:hypothetical protein
MYRFISSEGRVLSMVESKDGKCCGWKRFAPMNLSRLWGCISGESPGTRRQGLSSVPAIKEAE